MTRGKTAGSTATAEAAFRACIRTYGLLKRFMEPYFAQHGISGAQWGMLRSLRRAEKEGLPGLRLTDLGERLLVRPPSVTAAVDRLQRLRLVARTASAKDLRAKQVSLTSAGRQLVERLGGGRAARVESALGALSQAQQRELVSLLARIEKHLETLGSADRHASVGKELS